MAAPLLLMMFLAQQGGAAMPATSPAQALTELQQAIRTHPEIESNYTDLGNLLLRTHNFNEAAVVLEAARKRFPDSAQAALSSGVAYYGLRPSRTRLPRSSMRDGSTRTRSNRFCSYPNVGELERSEA